MTRTDQKRSQELGIHAESAARGIAATYLPVRGPFCPRALEIEIAAVVAQPLRFVALDFASTACQAACTLYVACILANKQ